MKNIIKMIFITAICLYTYISYVNFKHHSIFNIKKVDVKTQNSKLVANLITTLGSLKGKNIWDINIYDLKTELLKDVRIKKVIIKKSLPDSLIIALNVREPFIYINYKKNNNIYISSKDGEIYGYLSESTNYHLPLYGINKIENIKEFNDTINKIPFKKSISQVHKIDHGMVITMNDGLKIISDKNVNKDKYENSEQLYQKIKFNYNKFKKIDYIDLRFKDYIIKEGI